MSQKPLLWGSPPFTSPKSRAIFHTGRVCCLSFSYPHHCVAKAVCQVGVGKRLDLNPAPILRVDTLSLHVGQKWWVQIFHN
jgi:hypothetical protein